MSYRTSASQIATAEDCLRKWAILKIEKIVPPPNRFAAFGTTTHKHLETWFGVRVMPPDTPEGRTARAILQHLPPPQQPGLEVEQAISLTLGHVPLRGFVDLRNLTLDVPFVSDHKTTSDLCWAKRPDDLIDDPQATIYAQDAMNLTGATSVHLQWTYATRDKKPKSKPVRRLVTLDEIRPRIDKSIETANTLETLFDAAPHWSDVPYDATACEKYGGCPFQDTHCKLTPTERIRSVMSQEQAHSDFLARLRAKRSNGAADDKTPAPHPPPAVNPPPEAVAFARAAGLAAEEALAPEQKIANAAGEVLAKNETPEPAKKRKKRGRPKKEAAPAPAPAPEPEPTPQPQPQAVAGDLLSLMNKQFAEGFRAGWKAAIDASTDRG